MKAWIITTRLKHGRLVNRGMGMGVEDKNLMYNNPIRKLYLEGKKRGIEVEVLTPQDIHFFVSSNQEHRFFVFGEESKPPDFVIPRTGAGTSAKAIALYRQLEMTGIPLLNQSHAIEAAIDKFHSIQLLLKNGLPVPESFFISGSLNSTNIEAIFEYPVVLKIWPGTNGRGVFLAENKHQLSDVVAMLKASNISVNIMVQEYIQQSRGRDIRVFVLDGKVLKIGERYALDGGFKSNYARGGGIRELEEIPEVVSIALKATKALGLECAGVDILYDVEGYKICEVNSAPGFEVVETIGLNPAPFMYDYILNKKA